MSYKEICLAISINFLCISTTMANDASVELCGDIKQGEMIVGKSLSASEVIFNKKKYLVNKDGEFVIALGRDEPKEAHLYIVYDNGRQKNINFEVMPANWDIQNIKGLPPKKVTPSKEDKKEIMRERDDVKKAVSNANFSQDWAEGFVLPVEGRISGTFGSQRILNGQKRSPHSGVDIAQVSGTSVKSAGSGKVVLNGSDYFYTGNLVVVDHGQGLQTLYAHLESSSVNLGDEVKKGDVIGSVGSTGRSTGPHLHWGASINNVRFNPHSLLDINSKMANCKKF